MISKASRLRSPSGQTPNPKRQKHLNATFGNFTTVTTASYSQNRSSIPCNQKHEIDLFCSNRVSIYSSAGLLGGLAQSTKQEPDSLGVHQGWWSTPQVPAPYYPNGPEAGRKAGWGSEFVPLKKREVGSFILLHKIWRTACCFGIRTFLKQYNYYESATIWYTDHQYLAQYSEIINNLWEIPLIFCNYAVRSCGTWLKGPGQSPCNVLSISDLELYVTETSTGVCDPVTD